MIRKFRIDGEDNPNLSLLCEKIHYTSHMGEEMSHGYIEFYDPEFYIVGGTLLQKGAKFSFKWGPTDRAATPWQNYIVYDVECVYNPRGGATVFVYICDNRVRLLLDSAFHTYRGTPFSGVVEEIAKSYNLPDPVIEPTLISKDWYQCGEKDWTFMNWETPRQVSSGKQIGDYRLFFKHGNELHFHPPDFEQDAYRTINIHGSTILDKFRIKGKPFESAIGGGEAVTIHGYNYDKLETLQSTQGRDNIEDQSITALASKEFRRLTQTGRNPRTFTGAYKVEASENEEEIEAIAKASFQKRFNQSYWAETRIQSDPKIQPGVLVYVSTAIDGKPLMGEGLWLVETVHHEIPKSQEGITRILLSRSLMNKGEGDLQVKVNQSTKIGSGSLSPTEGEHVSNFSLGSSKTKQAQPL